MKRLWIGWGFAAVAGLLLAIGSLQVRSMPECGFLSFSPLSGQEAGGAPLPYLGRQIIILAAMLDWIFWTFPFAFIATVFSLLWRWPRLRVSATTWITELFILLPAWQPMVRPVRFLNSERVRSQKSISSILLVRSSILDPLVNLPSGS